MQKFFDENEKREENQNKQMANQNFKKDEKPLMRGVQYEEEAGVEEKELVRGVLYEENTIEDFNSAEPVFSAEYEKTDEALDSHSEDGQKNLIPGVIYLEETESEMETADKLIPGVFYEKEVEMPMKGQSSSDNIEYLKNLMQEQPEAMLEILKAAVVQNQATAKETQTSNVEVVTSNTLNFEVSLEKIVMFVYDTERGENSDIYYNVKVTVLRADGKLQIFQADVPAEKIKGTEWLKRVTRSLAKIPSNKEEKEAYQEKIQRCIETQNIPTEMIYPRAGWRYISGQGWRYIYRDGVIGYPSSLIHTVKEKNSLYIQKDKLRTKETFQLAMDMSGICQNGVASTELLIFTHATLLCTLFEEAGFKLNFVFGIAGVTNSRKTSMVSAMSQIFDRTELKPDAQFALATEGGIEKVLSLYGDSPIFIDDFKPGITRGEQIKMDKKLDTLVRFYGDRVEKRRMTEFAPNADKIYFPIGGGCVLTMELVTGVLSSITRMFITEISKDDVMNERLGIYQTERWILPTHVYDFISWVTEQFDAVVEYIRQNYDNMRRSRSFEFGRYGDMYATFTITAKVLMIYAIERGFWSQVECENFVYTFDDIILAELKRMENRAIQKDKSTLAIQAFEEAIDKAAIAIAELTPESAGHKFPFYQNETYYFVRVNEMRQLANNYSYVNRENLEIVNGDELIALLERRGILDISSKGERSRKLPHTKGNGLRYLWMKKSVLQSYRELV